LIAQLRDATCLVGADRAAVLWIDEYGPALVHVHCLLDLVSDAPRGGFASQHLRAAWEAGIPGIVDYADFPRHSTGPLVDAPRSLAAVALGSDGARAWFLAVDGVTPRRPLTEEIRGELMFLAGECASIVLHRDTPRVVEGAVSLNDGDHSVASRFTGWAVLKDIEGHEEDQAMNRRIASRFLVARAVRTFVDDDFAAAAESLEYQLAGVRRELNRLPAGDLEYRAWTRVLDALSGGNLPELASATVELATVVERQDHFSGALELFRTGFDIAAVCGATLVAVDAARFRGRVHRRLTQWDNAFEWYGHAREIARCAGEPGRESVVLDGLGTTYRLHGNLPKARELLLEALALGRGAGDRYAEGSALHSLAGVTKLMGRLDEAVEFGWGAVRVLREGESWLGALTDLAGIFVEAGELQAAEDAYTIVSSASKRYVYRATALDALSYVAALKGDLEEFTRRAARSDANGWKDAVPGIRAEFSYFRGKSYQALGDAPEAKQWYLRARDLAEEHGLNKILFDTEDALRSLKEASPESAEEAIGEPTPDVMFPIRKELSKMREMAAG